MWTRRGEAGGGYSEKDEKGMGREESNRNQNDMDRGMGRAYRDRKEMKRRIERKENYNAVDCEVTERMKKG